MTKTTVVRWNARTADEDTVFIGRPTKWGNPFVIGKDGTRAEVLDTYILWFIQPAQAAFRGQCREQLRGKKLACFCAPLPCHGHVIAYYADVGDELSLYTRAGWTARV